MKALPLGVIILLNLLAIILFGGSVVYKVFEPQPVLDFVAVPAPPPQPMVLPDIPPPPTGGQVAGQEPAPVIIPPEMSIPVFTTTAPSGQNMQISLSSTAHQAALQYQMQPHVAQSKEIAKDSQGFADDPSKSLGSVFGLEDGKGIPQFQGFLYDLKQTSDRQPTGMTPELYHDFLRKFTASHWPRSMLDKYYQFKTPVFTPRIYIPMMRADQGPKAFHAEKEVAPRCWIIWYHAHVVPQATTHLRFLGICDDILLVRINGRDVLDGSLVWVTAGVPGIRIPHTVGQSGIPEPCHLYEGGSVHVSEGEPVDMDIIIGEQPGGVFYAYLYCLPMGPNVALPLDLTKTPLPIFSAGDVKLPNFMGTHPHVDEKQISWNVTSDTN